MCIKTSYCLLLTNSRLMCHQYTFVFDKFIIHIYLLGLNPQCIDNLIRKNQQCFAL